MRQQEDKIYAMEDYMAQYQQMLCETRRENARLRRELADRKSSSSSSRSPTPASPTAPPPWRPEREDGPSISPPGIPTTPPPTTPAGPPDIEPAGSPGIDSTLPDVPPLDASSLDEIDLDEGAQLREVSLEPISSSSDGDHRPTRESLTPPNHAQTQPRVLIAWADEPGPPAHIWLNGEVFPAVDRAETRLLVDVEPLAAGGGPATCSGPLSLMVLDPDAAPGRRSLARWDFSADQVQQTAERVANGRALRFRLQLPDDLLADLPADRPVELWVRLVDEAAGKLLAHVGIDLDQRSRFTSIRPPAPARDQLADQTPDRTLAESRALAQRPGWSQWQTARPGESNLLAERTGRAEGNWQAAAAPPPAPALGLPVPAVTPASAESEPLPATSDDRYDVEPPLAIPPSWSPTR